MRYLYVLATLVVLFACDSDYELKQSVFIEDAASPGLPRYSEWGYNTFGAYYGREKFVSNEVDVPLNVIHEGSTTSFEFNGQLGSQHVSSGFDNSFSMTLTYEGFNPESYEDLIELNNVTLDLMDVAHTIVFKDATGAYQAEILSGHIHVKRAQHLLVDRRPTQVILSGVFEMQAKINGVPVTISDGRFDIGVSPDNFFKY
jgi:hypothetical protein